VNVETSEEALAGYKSLISYIQSTLKDSTASTAFALHVSSKSPPPYIQLVHDRLIYAFVSGNKYAYAMEVILYRENKHHGKHVKLVGISTIEEDEWKHSIVLSEVLGIVPEDTIGLFPVVFHDAKAPSQFDAQTPFIPILDSSNWEVLNPVDAPECSNDWSKYDTCIRNLPGDDRTACDESLQTYTSCVKRAKKEVRIGMKNATEDDKVQSIVERQQKNIRIDIATDNVIKEENLENTRFNCDYEMDGKQGINKSQFAYSRYVLDGQQYAVADSLFSPSCQPSKKVDCGSGPRSVNALYPFVNANNTQKGLTKTNLEMATVAADLPLPLQNKIKCTKLQ
jgi:hypothetical protein